MTDEQSGGDGNTPEARRASGYRGLWLAAPFVFALAIGAAQFAAIWTLNDGRFIYTVDDAYIHLSVSESIAKFHYGINEGEMAAPASSILWPFLLAPAAGQRWHEYLPLILAGLSALGALYILLRLFQRGGLLATPHGPAFAAGFLVIAFVTFNFVTVIFTGMEHSLQILVALLAVYGMAVFIDTGRTPWWFIAALVVGPLVRYELAAITLAAVVVLLLRGRHAAGLGSAAGAAGLVAAFALFLYFNGLPVLPNSVLLHSVTARTLADAAAMESLYAAELFARARALALNLVDAVYLAEGRIVAAMASILFVQWVWNPRHAMAPMRLFAVIAAGLILVFGQFDGIVFRYQTYLWVFMIASFVYTNMGVLIAFCSRVTPGYGLMLAAALCMTLGWRAVYRTATVPEAANNIYEQQYQMHRFVTGYYRAPVGVNDLGWVSYRNPEYVLDLFGLGSNEARIARLSDEPEWMDRLVKEHGVGLTMLYSGWFPGQIPPHWNHVAVLRLGGKQRTVAETWVDFYVTDPDARAHAIESLRAFAPDLPERVTLTLLDTAGAPDAVESPPTPEPSPDATLEPDTEDVTSGEADTEHLTPEPQESVSTGDDAR